MEWSLLAGVPPDDRDRFLGIARSRRYDRGDVVFVAGVPGDSLHLIASGKFAVRANTEVGDMALLNLLSEGDCFGELALIGPDTTRTAMVTALEPGETLLVHRSEFERLRDEHPSVDRVLVSILSMQVRRLSERLVETMYLPVDARIYRRVLTAAGMWGGAGPGAVIPLTQEDVAGLAGTTRPTANRVLRQAEASGLLALRRGRIQLLDPVAMAAEAGGGPPGLSS